MNINSHRALMREMSVQRRIKTATAVFAAQKNPPEDPRTAMVGAILARMVMTPDDQVPSMEGEENGSLQ